MGQKKTLKKKKNYVTIAIDSKTRDKFSVWCDDRGLTYDKAINNVMERK